MHQQRTSEPSPHEQRLSASYRVAESDKSTIYRTVLPAINSGRVRLLDHARLLGQYARLERRTSRSGKDLIDHPPTAHDDLCNSASGALCLASASAQPAQPPSGEPLPHVQEPRREPAQPRVN